MQPQDSPACQAHHRRPLRLPLFASCSLAYDGRGNAVVKSEEDIAAAVEALGGYEKGLYAEK